MDKFYIIGCAQALFFIALILTKKRKKLIDYVLSFFIFLLGGNLLFIYSAKTSEIMNSSIILFDIFYWTLLGPTLYIYTDLSITGQNKLKLKYLYLFIPMILVIVGFKHFIFVDPKAFFYSMPPDSFMYKLSINIWLYNSPIFYIITILLLRKHKKNIHKYYSYTRNVDFKWLNYLTHGFAVFILFLLFGGIVSMFFNVKLPFSSYSYTWLVMVIYIFGIGFFGYKQKGIFSDNELISENINSNNSETLAINNYEDENLNRQISESLVVKAKSLYEKSGLSDKEANMIHEKLLLLMETEKPYLDCELDLATLSAKLKTTNNKLSQVINEKLGKNFFDFVNEYRIAEVKKQLSNPKNNDYKLISIAYESGFNSKSTFYNLFKKYTNLTPKEYKQKLQSESIILN